MIDFNEQALEDLMNKNLISDLQTQEIKKYRDLNIFSLHIELRFLLYLSVLLFTAGIGTLVYKNIATIGHSFILATILVLIAICFYFAFKNFKGFSKNEVLFKNSLFDYLVLLGTILSCTFIGYLQYQYVLFGASSEISVLVGSAIAFGVAYYFDNKSALSIAITGLATFIGITITPATLIENEVYSNPTLSHYGLALAVLLVIWTTYCNKTNFKKHFSLVYFTFALHLSCICAIAGLLTKFSDEENSYWYLFIPILSGLVYYFNKVSYQFGALSIFLFNVIYAYVAFNIFIAILFSFVDNWGEIWILLLFLLPVYLIISIVFFIKGIKKFNIVNQ